MATGFFARNSLDPLATEAENASDFANLAKDWAIKMDGPVEGESYSSQWNATLSAQSAVTAGQAVTDASAQVSLAAEWAGNGEDVPVSGTSAYSAYHWALKAQGYALEASQNAAAVSAFAGLSDTPEDYAGQAGKAVVVNSTEDGLEFAGSGGGSSSTSTDIVTDATTARTLAVADLDKYIRFTNAGAVTVTVPDNAAEAFAVNSEIHLRATTDGTVTIAAAGGVTINVAASGGLVLAEAGATATLKKVGTDEWDLFGLVSA